MEELSIRPALLADLLAIAALIGDLNTRPEHRCLHCDEDEAAVQRSIEQLSQPAERAFEVATTDRRLLGVIGCDSDEERGRGWLWGPFVDHNDWDTIAGTMLEQLLRRLPANVRQLDTFMDLQNQRGIDLYLKYGFTPRGVTHVYYAPRRGIPIVVEQPCPDLAEADTAEFAVLHDAIFPGTYLPADKLLARRDALHRVFVYKEHDQILGYLYASPSDGEDEGFVHFVGVRPDARGRGIGRQLLLTALHWLFEECGFSGVALTVGDERGNAKALYLRTGFELKYSGASARKTW